MIITSFVVVNGALQPPDDKESSMEKLRRDWILDSMGYLIKPQCEWGVHSQWLENGLIEVDLMPN